MRLPVNPSQRAVTFSEEEVPVLVLCQKQCSPLPKALVLDAVQISNLEPFFRFTRFLSSDASCLLKFAALPY